MIEASENDDFLTDLAILTKPFRADRRTDGRTDGHTVPQFVSWETRSDARSSN